MSNSNLTKLSVSLMPVQDIQELLRYQYDFITKYDNATDTNSVAGIPAGKIAVAIHEDERTTILNSLRLGNKPANEYMTKEDGGHITQNYNKIRRVYSNEVRDLRDELYQLKNELAKRGIVTNYNPYAGFQDSFRSSDTVYMKEAITTVLTNSMERDEINIAEYAFKQLDVDDYIVLHLRDIDRFHVARVTHLMPNGETVKFTPSSAYDIKGGSTDLHKSLGMYENGSFAFARPAEKIPTTRDYYSTLNDDTTRHRKNVTANNKGFGYTFRISDSMFAVDGEPKREGYLVKVRAKVARYGNPGSLTAYIIDEENIESFKNPVQAEDDGILLAKSKPVTPANDQVERMIDFDFFDGISYPILSNGESVHTRKRFCMIIEANGELDNSNYYRFMFLQHKNENTGEVGDLQLNNILYEYSRKDTNSDESALETNSEINDSDLFYSVITKGIVTNGSVPFREGVYTSKISLQDPVEISRARLMLRVNREGYFTAGEYKGTDDKTGEEIVTEVVGSIQDGNNLNFMHDNSIRGVYGNDINGVGAKNHEDWVVVGNQLRKLINQSRDYIQLDKGVFLDGPRKPIYRVGYKVFLKAIRKEYNPHWNEYVVKDKEKIELPLSAVMPDRVKRSDKISDRIIFENEFIDKLDPDLSARYFNEFELQIYWKTEYSAEFNNDNYKDEFVGRIHDLVLSFDKSI